MWKRGDLCDVLITDWDSVGFQGKWYLGVYLATAGALHVVAYDYNGWRVSYSIEDCRIRPVPDATPIRIITMDHQDQDIPDDYASQGEQKPLTRPELVGQPNRDASPEPRNWSAGYETE